MGRHHDSGRGGKRGANEGETATGGFIRETLRTHLGQDVFECFGTTWAPMLERGCTLIVFWLILLWMYRRKVFLRI